MSSNLHKKSAVEERLDDIYYQRAYQEHVQNVQEESINTTTKDWWDIENEKRAKFKYYYENYSFGKFIIDFFLVIATSGFIIIFFIYRHGKHKEYRKRVTNKEFQEADFLKPFNHYTEGIEDAKFLDKKI